MLSSPLSVSTSASSAERRRGRVGRMRRAGRRGAPAVRGDRGEHPRARARSRPRHGSRRCAVASSAAGARSSNQALVRAKASSSSGGPDGPRRSPRPPTGRPPTRRPSPENRRVRPSVAAASAATRGRSAESAPGADACWGCRPRPLPRRGRARAATRPACRPAAAPPARGAAGRRRCRALPAAAPPWAAPRNISTAAGSAGPRCPQQTAGDDLDTRARSRGIAAAAACRSSRSPGGSPCRTASATSGCTKASGGSGRRTSARASGPVVAATRSRSRPAEPGHVRHRDAVPSTATACAVAERPGSAARGGRRLAPDTAAARSGGRLRPGGDGASPSASARRPAHRRARLSAVALWTASTKAASAGPSRSVSRASTPPDDSGPGRSTRVGGWRIESSRCSSTSGSRVRTVASTGAAAPRCAVPGTR